MNGGHSPQRAMGDVVLKGLSLCDSSLHPESSSRPPVDQLNSSLIRMELCMEIYPNFEWFRRDYLEISNDDWLATFWMTMWLFGARISSPGPGTLWRYQWSGRNPARSPVSDMAVWVRISSPGSLEIPEGRPEPRTQPRRPSI